MMDFLMISTRKSKDVIEVYPKFIIPTVRKSTDLMIRGGDFYAVWIEELGLWSTDEGAALQLIDHELDKYVEENREKLERKADNIRVLHMWDSGTGMIDVWHKYCQRQLRDSFHMLDENLIFSNTKPRKEDYASKRLPYPLEDGDISSYDRLMSVLYSPEERQKIEWAIGAIVSGDSKYIQKFMVFYGAMGTGKSTVLNIIQKLFEGYYTVFDAKSIGSAHDAFALEPFKMNPLVAIQHDGDLSRIEDNTRLNSLVSHEEMTINEKHKSLYSNRFKCFLFMGTNKPVKITDAKSGLIRRLIDVSPTGEKLNAKEYHRIMKNIDFELGAIAKHCLDVYKAKPDRYDSYIPVNMMGASNDFYNFIIDSYYFFKKEDATTLKAAWEMYKTYCDDAKVPYPYSLRPFKEELKNYFQEFKDRDVLEDGTRVRNRYIGFRADKFENRTADEPEQEEEEKPYSIIFEATDSIFDKEYADCIAQLADEEDKPRWKWENVRTKLSDIDTSLVHYVLLPDNHVVIDFDLKDENGNKSLELNLAEANKWPPTYAEISKGGAGIHLHYIYTGDVEMLERLYAPGIEIKVFSGKASLRRRLSKCNRMPIATISSGLPKKKKGDIVVNGDRIKSEAGLRRILLKNLNKEVHPGTKPSIDFIVKILDDAYKSDLEYDVTDMQGDIFSFAAGSTHHADYCLDAMKKMHFKSKKEAENVDDATADLVFYDVEVFPNLFLVNWKIAGEGKPVVRMINPGPAEIEELIRFNLVGFNCRKYDNHILYARLIGYSNYQLYELSSKIINSDSDKDKPFFGEAYNISYTDVYDFCSKKQSLKKWEIELGIHHQELGLPWDQPVPEELWPKVAEYCDNDVLATEAVFNERKADFVARKILAELAGGTPNDTTNTLTTKIIFGNEKHPKLIYTNLATGEQY